MLTTEHLYRMGYFNDEPEAVVDGGAEPEITADNAGDEQPAVSAEDVQRLQAALRREREQRRSLEKEMKAAQSRLGGVDLEEYEQLKQAQAEAAAKEEQLRREQLEKKQQYDELIKLEKQKAEEKIAEYQRQQRELQDRLSSMQKETRESAIRQEFIQAWNDPEVSGNPRLQQAAFTQLYNEGRLNYNSETRQVEVVNPITGDAELDALGSPISVREFLNGKLKQEIPDFFLARQKGGTGATPTQGSIGGSRTGTISFEERLKLGKKRAQITALRNKNA